MRLFNVTGIYHASRLVAFHIKHLLFAKSLKNAFPMLPAMTDLDLLIVATLLAVLVLPLDQLLTGAHLSAHGQATGCAAVTIIQRER